MTADGTDPAAPPAKRDDAPPPADEPEPNVEVDADAGAATREPASPAATQAGPVAVLTEALTLAAGSSRLLRRASIYIGLLMLALAGPGVVAGLALVGSLDLFDPTATMTDQQTSEAARAGILIAIALIGAIIASIEGAAIGITLLAGRVLDRPISLAAALERSRKVFWRIIRAGLIVGVLEVVVSHLWQVVTGKAQIGDLAAVGTEPLPGAIATLPFVYATVAIVLADDGARAALRRSMSIARGNRRLTVALGLFGLLAGVVQTFALGSGLDLITRVTEALHLDITAGGLSFLLAGALALAIVMAAGSLLFTVTAIVNAPKIVAWSRLGLSFEGLPLEGLPTVPMTGVSAAPATSATDPLPAYAVASGAGPELTPAPAITAWGQPEAQALSAWALSAAADAQRPFRWVTLPMRFTVLGMWLIAIVSLVTERPI